MSGESQNASKKGQRVLLKPNLAYPYPPPATTDPRVVAAVARLCLKAGAAQVLVGDSSAYSKKRNLGTGEWTNRDVIERTGMRTIVEEAGATIVDFDEGEWRPVKIPNGVILREVPIAASVLDANVLINIPAMKTHLEVLATLSLKNYHGIIPDHWKVQWHKDEISQKIVDLHKVVHTDLTVMDALVGMEGLGPRMGTPVQMGLVLAASDMVALDAVAADIMGFEAGEVECTRIAAAQGIGIMDPSRIEVLGEAVSRVRKNFKRPDVRISGHVPGHHRHRGRTLHPLLRACQDLHRDASGQETPRQRRHTHAPGRHQSAAARAQRDTGQGCLRRGLRHLDRRERPLCAGHACHLRGRMSPDRLRPQGHRAPGRRGKGTMSNILEMKKITKRFPGVLALDNVDFSVRKGEVHALVGENGAGKSTLMKVLAGAIMRDGGEILFDGKPADIRYPLDAQKLGISIIYQEFNLVPHLSVAENIFLGHLRENKGGFVDWRSMRKAAEELLKRLGVEVDVRTIVSRLGVAHQQLIEIARALSTDARLIIMDEPTAALSIEEIDRLFRVVQQLRDQEVSIIFITHHIKEIFEIAETTSVLRDGVLVGVRDVKSLTEVELVRMMIGRSLKDTGSCKACELGPTVLGVRNLKRAPVLNDISFDLRQGEILGLAGLMGSGRTELVRAIFGADPIDSGQIIVNGRKAAIRSPRDAIRAGLGLAPEDRKSQGLVLILPVIKNVTLSFIQRIMNLFGIHFRKERGIVQGLIQKLEVKTPSLGQNVVNLSGGNQQKIVLCKWLGSGARIYLLDEPTRGVDIGAKEMIYQVIRRLVDEGSAVILISSDLEEVLQMSDRILAMNLGRITRRVPEG